MEDDTDIEAYYDQEGPIGQGVGLEDACPQDLNSEPVNEREFMNIKEEGELNILGKCSRVDVLVASHTRKSKNAVNALTLEKNTLATDEIKKLKELRDQGLNDKTDEQIFQDVLGKDTHGYLKAYGPELIEVKEKVDQLIEEARKDAENARMEAEQAKKEAEAVRNDVDRKIEQNNAIWEKKFHQLMNFIKGGTYSNDDDSGNES
ncbi:(-)-camphene/tricyclene synthase chloroplastic [Bienertia sinuspersici]